jgi:hypothetical protein
LFFAALHESTQKLDRPVPTKDGGTLRTIREACDYMTGMGKKRELRQQWQRAAKLILAQADVMTRQQVARAGPYSWMPSWTCPNSNGIGGGCSPQYPLPPKCNVAHRQTRPGGHEHIPFTQVAPTGQLSPHLPQLA